MKEKLGKYSQVHNLKKKNLYGIPARVVSSKNSISRVQEGLGPVGAGVDYNPFTDASFTGLWIPCVSWLLLIVELDVSARKASVQPGLCYDFERIRYPAEGYL